MISKALNDFAAFGVQHTLKSIPADLFDGVLSGSGEQQKQLDPERLNLVIRVLDELPDQTLDMVSAHVDCLKMIVTGWQGVKRIIHHHRQQQQHQQYVMQMQQQQQQQQQPQQQAVQIGQGQFQGQGNMSMYPTPNAPMTMPQRKNSIATGQVMTNQQQNKQQQTHQRQKSQPGKQPQRTSRLTRRATQSQRRNHKFSKSEPTIEEMTKLRKANTTIPVGSSEGNGGKNKSPIMSTTSATSSSTTLNFKSMQMTSTRSESISTPKRLGEAALLKVDPIKPAILKSDLGDFFPKGVLMHDLSVKPKQKCLQCGSESTPEWRRGPDTAKVLCNACGLFRSKLIKKYGDVVAEEMLKKRRDEGKGEDRSTV
ncbi:unnamed protein product [Ambrosiozyma monospora]|uniref:Unnamed protein product n=1 Tax=Ambrosiozyma monospora TaxID=43982 RepID=A0ACB5T052_AMBMO|nr:unnamed protein product [Ambrosiozyma monospora]